MSEERKSKLERRQDRAALRDAVPAVVALVVLEGIVAAFDLDADSNGWHLVISLSPLLAGVWLAWVQLRTLRRCDEYQRTMHLEAMSVGFARGDAGRDGGRLARRCRCRVRRAVPATHLHRRNPVVGRRARRPDAALTRAQPTSRVARRPTLEPSRPGGPARRLPADRQCDRDRDASTRACRWRSRSPKSSINRSRPSSSPNPTRTVEP